MTKKYDVIVIGGGTAGTVAAIAAARNGAKVLVIESGSHVGGLSSIGMTWGGFFDNNYQRIIGGIPHELVEKCQKRAGRGYFSYVGDDKWITVLASVDAESARLVMEQELYDAGCDVILFSTVYELIREGTRIIGVKVASRISQQEYHAKIFIDTTGDATVACMAGVPWEHGGKDMNQCVSNMFRICGADMQEYERFLEEKINTEGKDPWKLQTGGIRNGVAYWCPWKPDGFENMPKSLGFYFHGQTGDVILNCTSADINPMDIEELSKASFHLRQEAFKVFDYLKQKVPAFRNSYLAQVYEMGVRESRRIIGDRQITIENIVRHDKFPDTIGTGAYPPDLHRPDGEVHIHSTRKWEGNSDGAYELPLSAMTIPGYPNLIVAGRSISATFEAQSAARGIGPCMVEGQGAGTAAALFVQKEYDDIHQLEIAVLQRLLQEQGVLLQKEEV
jgi:hypothetical protein